MRQIGTGEEGHVVEMSRREMEFLCGCVVEACEALSEDEFRIRLGVGHEACRLVIDEIRTMMGWLSVEEMRLRQEPLFGLDGRGPASSDKGTPSAPTR